MDVITIEEFCRFMNASRQDADILIYWRVLDTVQFQEQSLITMPSVTRLIERLEADDNG